MKEYPFYCGGIFRKSDNLLTVSNPYNEEIIAQTFLASDSHLESAIHAAMELEKELKNLPTYKRYEILMQIAKQLESEKNRIAELLCLESAKPIKYATGEINRAIQTFIIEVLISHI